MIDSHCHFNFPEFSDQHALVWARCCALGLRQLIIPAVSPDQIRDVVVLTEDFEGIYFSVGLHPWYVSDFYLRFGDDALLELERLIRQEAGRRKCVAIGEAGVDALIDCSLDKQLAVLDLQMRLAVELDLPIILHQRKSQPSLLRLIKRYPSIKGVIHGFSGSLEQAQEYWSRGLYLGVGGVITYSRANKTRNALALMPLEALLLETDAPDMPLSGKQGAANSPLNLPLVAVALADIRHVDLAIVKNQTVINTYKLFNRLECFDHV